MCLQSRKKEPISGPARRRRWKRSQRGLPPADEETGTISSAEERTRKKLWLGVDTLLSRSKSYAKKTLLYIFIISMYYVVLLGWRCWCTRCSVFLPFFYRQTAHDPPAAAQASSPSSSQQQKKNVGEAIFPFFCVCVSINESSTGLLLISHAWSIGGVALIIQSSPSSAALIISSQSDERMAMKH